MLPQGAIFLLPSFIHSLPAGATASAPLFSVSFLLMERIRPLSSSTSDIVKKSQYLSLSKMLKPSLPRRKFSSNNAVFCSSYSTQVPSFSNDHIIFVLLPSLLSCTGRSSAFELSVPSGTLGFDFLDVN